MDRVSMATQAARACRVPSRRRTLMQQRGSVQSTKSRFFSDLKLWWQSRHDSLGGRGCGIDQPRMRTARSWQPPPRLLGAGRGCNAASAPHSSRSTAQQPEHSNRSRSSSADCCGRSDAGQPSQRLPLLLAINTRCTCLVERTAAHFRGRAPARQPLRHLGADRPPADGAQQGAACKEVGSG